MAGDQDIVHGTLGLIVLKTLESLGPLHGYKIARRIEQISDCQLTLNQGSLYAVPGIIARFLKLQDDLS